MILTVYHELKRRFERYDRLIHWYETDRKHIHLIDALDEAVHIFHRLMNMNEDPEMIGHWAGTVFRLRELTRSCVRSS